MYNVSVIVIHGTSQYVETDFYTQNQYLVWRGGPLEGLLSAGDVLYVIYERAVYQIDFSYSILSSQSVLVINNDWSRIYDDVYVYPGFCPDPIKSRLSARFEEHINFLDDYSMGIKLKFFNKDTYQLEEHVFNGPVFETYLTSEDQIATPDSFANALIRIRGPICNENPLTFLGTFDFINDSLVRFRKKTYRELLPDRTFRTIKLTEVLPV
jgi:hypothetical protein